MYCLSENQFRFVLIVENKCVRLLCIIYNCYCTDAISQEEKFSISLIIKCIDSEAANLNHYLSLFRFISYVHTRLCVIQWEFHTEAKY